MAVLDSPPVLDKDGFPIPPAPEKKVRAVEAPKSPRVTWAYPEANQVEVRLQVPVRVDGVLVESITIRRLTGGEMIAIVEADDAPEDDLALIRHVTAAMAGYPADVLDGLAPDDQGRVAQAAIPFYPLAVLGALMRVEAAMESEKAPDDPA